MPKDALELEHVWMEESAVEVHFLQERSLCLRIHVADLRLENFAHEMLVACLYVREEHLGETPLAQLAQDCELIGCVKLGCMHGLAVARE
jgi:hypothetical protein